MSNTFGILRVEGRSFDLADVPIAFVVNQVFFGGLEESVNKTFSSFMQLQSIGKNKIM